VLNDQLIERFQTNQSNSKNRPLVHSPSKMKKSTEIKRIMTASSVQRKQNQSNWEQNYLKSSTKEVIKIKIQTSNLLISQKERMKNKRSSSSRIRLPENDVLPSYSTHVNLREPIYAQALPQEGTFEHHFPKTLCSKNPTSVKDSLGYQLNLSKISQEVNRLQARKILEMKRSMSTESSNLKKLEGLYGTINRNLVHRIKV
jgi:hypothetical protein